MTERNVGTPNAVPVKAAAAGRWLEILPAAGIPAELLDGRGHPCPKCGGTDRFAAMKDVAERGAVLCRGCFPKGGGDGLAAVQWIRDIDFPAAVRFVADLLDISPTGQAHAGNGRGRIVATYDYRDAGGNLAYQAVRYEPKDFRQRSPKPGGGWNWTTKGIEPLPYRLPELLAADPSRIVAIVEGEKDADNVSCLGIIATTNHGGAGKWTKAHAQHLAGRRVAIIRDADEPGEKHAQAVASSLEGIAASVRIVSLPTGKDASDWIEAQPDAREPADIRAELERLAEAAPLWTPDAQPWPEIISFDVLDLPDFPTHVLPDALRRWVEAESHATQTPSDLAAMLSLADCSACIARRVEVEPRPGWREPTNIFTAIGMNPGERKSGVFSDCTKPLRDIEAEESEAARPYIAREQSLRRQDELRLRKLEKAAAEKGDAQAQADAITLAQQLALHPEPVLPRLIVDDITEEKLGMILAEQGGRIASMSPEGSVFDLMAGRYSKNSAPQFTVYLMGHAGDTLTTDRVIRQGVHVDRPALTCAYAVQPSVIRGIAQNQVFRGRGLLARFLYAMPLSHVGHRQIAPPSVPTEIREAYHKLIRSLGENCGNYGNGSEPLVLRLTPDASVALIEWEAEIEGMLADGGRMERIRDWGSKLAGATLRLAGILHCVERALIGRIETPTLTAAIQIARYLIPHAEAALHIMEAQESPVDEDARYILRWVERHGKREFSKTEAQHHGKRRFPKAEDVDPALSELSKRGYIRVRPVEVTCPGRPPSPVFEVNPGFFENENAEKRSHNSHNSPGEPQSGNSGNIGSASEQTQNTNRVRVTI